MTQITTLEQIKELGTILGIWAHPDDETFMSGGLLSAAVQNGQNVASITATRGELGVYDPIRWPAETIGATRALELAEALRILGVHHLHWLNYKDSLCKDVTDEDVLAKIMPIIEQHQPDTIVTFPPNGITGHDDHQAVSRWARLVTEKYEKPIKILYPVDSTAAYEQYFKQMDEKLNIYFNIAQPDLYERSECDAVLNFPPDIIDKKCKALAAMPSQTAAMTKEFSFDFLCQAFAEECYISAGNEHKNVSNNGL